MSRWWIPKKFSIPKVEKNGENRSAEVLRKSQRKLRDAYKDQQEVKKVTQESKVLGNSDRFAELLEQAMRGPNG